MSLTAFNRLRRNKEEAKKLPKVKEVENIPVAPPTEEISEDVATENVVNEEVKTDEENTEKETATTIRNKRKSSKK